MASPLRPTLALALHIGMELPTFACSSVFPSPPFPSSSTVLNADLSYPNEQDECTFSYDTPFAQGGVAVSLTTWQGYGEQYVGLDHERTGNVLYLLQKWKDVYDGLDLSSRPVPARASAVPSQAWDPQSHPRWGALLCRVLIALL